MTDKQPSVDASAGDERDFDDVGSGEIVVSDAAEDTVSALIKPGTGDESGDAEIDASAVAGAEPDPEPEVVHPADVHALGALALGVAPSTGDRDIRVAVAASPELQRELAALVPVADIMTSLYQAQPPAASPPTDQKARQLGGNRTKAAQPERRSLAAPIVTDRVARASQPAPRLSMAGVSTSTAVTIALGVIAALAVLWALALMDRVTARDDEIAALSEQVAQMRQAANATVFVLSPATEDVPEARGAIFSSIADRTILLDVSGLPGLEDDEVYQIWFQRDGSDEWELGPAFQVNSQGESIQRLAGDTPGFTRVAISREPTPGSTEPSEPFVLEGTLTGAIG